MSPVPGNPAASGHVLFAKLAAITDASATNPYLLKIEPGVYALPSTLMLKAHVDVEGSGEAVTTIGDANNVPVQVWAYGLGTAPVEVRSLTIYGTNDAHTMFAAGLSAVRLDSVTVVAECAGCRGLDFHESPSSLQDVTVRISTSGGAYGITARGQPLQMQDVDVQVTGSPGGINAALNMFIGDSFTVRGGRLSGDPAVFMSGGTLKASTLLLDGGVMQLGGTATCVGSFDADFTPLGSDCR